MGTRRIAVLSAGLSNPSSTRMLADRLAAATAKQLTERGIEVEIDVFELRDYAHDITNNLLTGFAPPALTRQQQKLRLSPRPGAFDSASTPSADRGRGIADPSGPGIWHCLRWRRC